MRFPVAVLAMAALAAPAHAPLRAQTRRPNVVLIVTDDVGYGDMGSYGAPDVRTANIDGTSPGRHPPHRFLRQRVPLHGHAGRAGLGALPAAGGAGVRAEEGGRAHDRGTGGHGDLAPPASGYMTDLITEGSLAFIRADVDAEGRPAGAG